MFWGEYAHHLDSKGRLIVPARFRSYLSHEAILTRGLDHNLVIYPQEAWHIVAEQLNHMSITDPIARALRRLLFSGAVEILPDRQGRILIPGHLRSYAALDDEVLVVGMETFLEVWQPQRWQNTLEEVSNVLAETSTLLKLAL